MSNSLSPDKLINMSIRELAEVSKEITGRLNNQDWQKIVHDLRVSGHIHTFHKSAPPFLQHYLRLETDLDDELAALAMASPLMSSLSLSPQRPRGDETRMIGRLSSQDTGSTMEIGVYPENDTMTVSFTVKNMLTLRFKFPHLDLDERRSFLEVMHRDSGIAILWTRERWEQDYMIFVKQEVFTRAYAFSSSFEALARLTNEATGDLLDWLERCWFPRSKGRRTKRSTAMLDPLSLPEAAKQAILSGQAPPQKAKVSEFSLQAVAVFWDKLSKLNGQGRAALMASAGNDADLLRTIFRSIDQPTEGKARNEATISRDSVLSEMKRHLDAMDRISARLDLLVKDEVPAAKPKPPIEDDSDASKFDW
jgi:hypothetical protein